VTEGQYQTLFNEASPAMKGFGLPGMVWEKKMLVIGEISFSDSSSSDSAAINTMLAMPVLENGKLKAIVTFLF